MHNPPRMARSRWRSPFVLYRSGIWLAIGLGIAHGLADAAAGWLLGNLARSRSLEEAGVLILVYNILGFGYQPLLGMGVDRLKIPRFSVLAGLLLLALALGIPDGQSLAAVVLAGIGSAAFHVGGGALAYKATPQRTIGPGLFSAPGVIGLTVGGVLGLTGHMLALPLMGLLGGVIGLVGSGNGSLITQAPPPLKVSPQPATQQDWLLLGLLGAISLSSWVWTSFQLRLHTQFDWLMQLAVAAAIAKVLGGWLVDRGGWQRWVPKILGCASLLLILGRSYPAALLLGLALLQSSIPLTLTATAQLLPNHPATAAGFALGLAILVGAIPAIAGLGYLGSTPEVAALLTLLTLLCLLAIQPLIAQR